MSKKEKEPKPEEVVSDFLKDQVKRESSKTRRKQIAKVEEAFGKILDDRKDLQRNLTTCQLRKHRQEEAVRYYALGVKP